MGTRRGLQKDAKNVGFEQELRRWKGTCFLGGTLWFFCVKLSVSEILIFHRGQKNK